METFWAQAVLNRIFRGTAYTPPTTLYFTAMNGGTEFTGTGYARVGVTGTSFAAATAAVPSVVQLSSDIDFGTVGGDWPTNLTGFRVYDAASGGNLLWSITITTRTLNSGSDLVISAGASSVFRLGASGAALWVPAYLATIMDWLFNGGSAPAVVDEVGVSLAGTAEAGVTRLALSSASWDPATAADPAVVVPASDLDIIGGSGAASAIGDYDEFDFYASSTRVFRWAVDQTYTIDTGDRIQILSDGTVNVSLT